MAYDPSLTDAIAAQFAAKMAQDHAAAKAAQSSKYAEGVDTAYVESFLADANSYSEKIQGILDGVTYSTAGSVYDSHAREADDLRRRAGKVMAWLDQNRENLGSDYESMYSQIRDFQGGVAENKNIFRQRRDYYSQWDTEDAYNAAMREGTWVRKYQGKGYEELAPILDTLEDGEEKAWLTEYAGAVDREEKLNLDLTAADREIEDLRSIANDAAGREQMLNQYRSNPLMMLTNADAYRDMESRQEEFERQYGSLQDLQARIAQKQQRRGDASQLQQEVQTEKELEEWKKTVRDSGSIQKEMDALNAQMASLQGKLNTAGKAAVFGNAGIDLDAGDAMGAGAAASGRMTAIGDIQKSIQTMQQRMEELERELQYSKMREYAALMNRPDFAEMSRYVPTGNGNAIRDNATGTVVDTGFKDIEYDFINKNDKAKNYQFTIDSLSNMERMGMDRKWLLQMTDDEVAVYNYLYNTEGKDAAGKYLDVMRSTLNQRQREAEEMQWAAKAKENPGLTSGFSVALAPLKAIGLMGQAVDYLADGSIDQNAAYNRASYVSTAIRNQVTEQIQQNEKWGAVGAFGYQTAMSMGDFLINGAAGGGLLGVPGITMAIMGSGAAADTVIRSKDNGLSDGQAFGLGVVAGLAEALTERFSLEALLDADLLKNGIGVYMLKNSLTEGSEEVASSIINMAADILVTKEKSEWQKTIRKYQEQGYSEGEAFGKALAEQAASLGMDFLGGALSGGIMSGANSAMYYADTKRTGRAMGRRGLTDAQQVQQILDEGANAGKGTAANAVAGQIQKKVDAGGELSAYDKGRLYQSNPEAVGKAVFGQGSVSLATPTTQGINNRDERWQQAQRLASITGRDIKFYNGAENENGYYDPKTGEIYVNTNSADTVAQVVSHELTHSTELAESYADLARYVRAKLRAEGRDWDKMKSEKAEFYAAQGHALEKDTDIEAEIVAEYVQKNLLTNEQEIYAAVWESPTLGQRILNWIDGILAKMNNQKAKERQMLNNAREIYARALEESRNKRTASQTNRNQGTQNRAESDRQQYAQEDLDYLDQMYREQYNRGEITEEEYDQYLAWREHEAAAEEGAEELGRQYSFAGEKARTADTGKLALAKELQRQGVDNETIRQQTGWFQGMDKKWRFEIDDSRMQYHRAGDARFAEMHADYARHNELTQRYIYGDLSQQELDELEALDEIWGREQNRLSQRVNRGDAQLQHILRHDALFEAYPELRGVKVRFEDMGPRDMGSYYPSNNLIVLNSSLRNAPQKTILHEVQHVIQNAEGYARGSNPDYWHRKLTEGGEPKTVGVVNALKRLQEFETDPRNSEAMRLIYQIKNAYEEEMLETVDELEQEAERKGLTDKLSQYEQLEYDYYSEQSKAYDMVPSELYQNTAGEIEARDTANRWNIGLDAEGRKNTPPDLGDERTVFAEGSERSYSIIDINGENGNYGSGVLLDTNIFDGVRTSEWGQILSRYVYQNLAGSELTVFDENGNAETVYLAKKTDRVRKDGAKNSHKVIDKLARYKGDNIVALATIHLSELLETSHYDSISNDHNHQWMDEKGWIIRKAYIQDRSGNIYEAMLNIADGRDRKILYSINNVRRIDKRVAHGDVPSTKTGRGSHIKSNSSMDNVTDAETKVNRQYSLNQTAVNKRDVARDLRAILSRGGDPRELQRYVDSLEQSGRNAEQKGVNRYQTAGNRNSTARDILEAAHSQGMGVEEYLRWNPEQFERNGKWRPEALEAMRLEQGERRYSLNAGKQGQKPEQNLSFRYEPINPRNSYFSTDGGGDYGLYADGTVIPNGDTLKGMNELTGWRNHGLFAMYTVMLDGRELDPQVQLPGGYFTVAEIIEHPKVKQSIAGYVIAEKGRIMMTDDIQMAAAPAQEEVFHSEIAEDEEVRRERDFYDDEKILEESGKLNSPEMKALLDRLQSEGNPRQSAEVNQEKAQQEGRTEPHRERKADSSEESQARVIQREHLPTKARSYLARAESNLLNSIGKALSVPRYARYNNLMGIIQEISDVYLAEGTISDEKLEELFDKAYAEGIVADSEFYDQYKEIKDHLRTHGVTLSERDRSDIADFEDFRKRAFGTLRILNEGGVPVDTAYGELHTMAPELFPESITHPADQLVRMFEVGQSIAISKKSLDEYYGPERDEFRRWAKNDFDAAVGDAYLDLRQVRRYADEESTKVETRKILTTEEAEEAFQELKKLRRNVDKVRAKNLLTESDEILLGRMLKGEIGPQHLNPKEDNVKGITALYEAKLAYESQVELLAAYKRSVRAKRLQDADRYLETATGWKDKRAGILYARETMRRNILDIVPDKKLAEQIAEHYFEAVHISEAKSTKFKTEYRDRVRALNLSTKVMKGNMVSEAHAVQLLGEAMDNIRVMENARGRMGMRDGKTLAEWRAVVDDLWMNNTGLDRQKVERAVEEFRKIYDELFQQMNRVRVENGYEPVNYRQGYFPHFQPGGDGIMGFFGKVMGINTQVDALPTTINGLTHTFKPGIQWFGNAQERIGFNTAYDAVEGFDRYIEGVASVIFQTENIQKLRALSTQARYRTSDEGIRKQVDAVRMDNRLTEEEKQREINAIYEHGRFALSNFVAELDEYTNLLANKKSKYDRTMESLIGRRAYTLMKAWENRVGANMIAGNLSSALTNFIPITQAGAQLDSGMMLKGMWDTLKNMRQGDGLVGMSNFLTNRRGSDVLVKTWMQKASGVMGTPMELIDNFTSESIVRAAYLQNLKRGMSEAEAMHQADIFASGLMADRSKGAMPTLFESRNPLFKAFTQFQLEVNNQFSEVFKDLPRNHREKGLAMFALVLLKYFLGAWLYNELFEKIIGRRSAMDPIGILMEAGEDLTGYEIPNLFDLVMGKKGIEKTGDGSIGEAGANLATNVLSELPFSAGLTLFGVETDGGRLPASSAVPDLSALWEATTEEGWTKEQRWKHIQDELNKLAYVVPPFGGAQISKTWKGIDAYLQGGSYGMDRDGNEILQYPVYKDDPEDAFWSLVRAAFLGKNSLPEAQAWAAAGYTSLNAYQTAVYQDLVDTGVKDRDAYAVIDQLRSIEETEAGARRAEGRRVLEKADISAEGKAVAYYGMVATNKERDWMNALAKAGADRADIVTFVSNLYDAEKKRGEKKKWAQYIEFLDAPLTEEEKIVAVGFIMDTELETEAGNPTQYAKFLSALETGLTVDKYMEIRATETDIEDYLELTDVGIGSEGAADLAIAIDALEPVDGYESVTWIQRCRTIMESDLPESEQMAALSTVMNESTYQKVEAGHNFGMNIKSYIDLKSVMPQFDENGNGSYSQQETEDAINALAGDDNALFALTGTTPNGYNLSDREKAILWQLQNKSWKPNRNPFDREVGQMVYDYLTAEDPAEAAATAQSGIAFDFASLLAKGK